MSHTTGGGPCQEGLRQEELPVRKTLKLYLNLALVSFTLGRAYGAFRQRLARGVARRRAWS